MQHCSPELVAAIPTIEEEVAKRCPVCNPRQVPELPAGAIGKPQWALGWDPSQGYYDVQHRAALDQQRALLQQQTLSREYPPWGIFGNILRRKP